MRGLGDGKSRNQVLTQRRRRACCGAFGRVAARATVALGIAATVLAGVGGTTPSGTARDGAGAYLASYQDGCIAGLNCGPVHHRHARHSQHSGHA
ncbi:hypothetical protein ACAG26_23780 [Mycobacterium sp. pUA109]|uniref:hypothetical protein n=1 Tax=Mycobacterium sp. pUA109 TaxID=3238982 RepID=UPI00351BCD4F